MRVEPVRHRGRTGRGRVQPARSPCATPASASRRSSRAGCSRRSARPTAPPRGSTAARASGLAISRRLARMMGGDLTLESDAGRRHDVHLHRRFGAGRKSRRDRRAPARHAPGAAGARRRGQRHEPRAARDAARRLASPPSPSRPPRRGWRCSSAATATASADPFGLVVLDWMLPGMDGLDAAARIRHAPETARPADRHDQRVRRQGGGGALRRARRQRLPAEAHHRVVAVRRDHGGAGRSRARGAGADRRAARARVPGRAGAAGRGQRGEPDGGDRAAGRLGIELDIAGNGREAVDMAQRQPGRLRRAS